MKYPPRTSGERLRGRQQMVSYSDQIFFQPWLGAQYGAGGLFRRRVLFLGESHYLWDASAVATRSLTQECIDEQRRGEGTHAFWTRVAIVGLGHAPSLAEKRRFWDSVAFNNYVQTPVGFGPRVRPTTSMWTAAQGAFLEILEVLAPDLVVVLGKELWRRLPEGLGPGPWFGGNRSVESWWYHSGERRGRARRTAAALALGFRHPSAGFSGQHWHAIFRDALVHLRGTRPRDHRQ